MVPIKQQVMIPMVTSHLEEGTFVATDIHEKSAKTLLEITARWAKALKAMR